MGPSVSLHGRKIQSQKNNTLNLSSVQLQIGGWKREREREGERSEARKKKTEKYKGKDGDWEGESRMQPCLLTREKYTFQSEIKLHLPHCCIPSDIATHLASPHSHRRKRGRDSEGGKEEEERQEPTQKREKERTSICFSHISGETMFASNTHSHHSSNACTVVLNFDLLHLCFSEI